jgi:hypothetical protein
MRGHLIVYILYTLSTPLPLLRLRFSNTHLRTCNVNLTFDISKSSQYQIEQQPSHVVQPCIKGKDLYEPTY